MSATAIYKPLRSAPEITREDVATFTNGGCHILADEISKLSGWPIHCFLDAEGSPDWHAFIVPRNGWRLDVEGLQLEHEHNARWAEYVSETDCEHSEFPYEEIVDVWGSVAEDDSTVSRAREVALLLLAAVEAEINVGGERL